MAVVRCSWCRWQPLESDGSTSCHTANTNITSTFSSSPSPKSCSTKAEVCTDLIPKMECWLNLSCWLIDWKLLNLTDFCIKFYLYFFSKTNKKSKFSLSGYAIFYVNIYYTFKLILFARLISINQNLSICYNIVLWYRRKPFK